MLKNIRVPTSGDSPNSNLSIIVDIKDLDKISLISSNTGSCSYEMLGEGRVKITCSGGSHVRSAYNSYKYSKYVSGQSSASYSDSQGYSGTLSSYQVPKQETLTKYVENQSSANYSDSQGYSGTLSPYQVPKQETLTKYVENQSSANYSDSQGYSGTLSPYQVTTPVQKKTVTLTVANQLYKKRDWLGTEIYNPASTIPYSSGGYTGNLSFSHKINYNHYEEGNVHYYKYDYVYTGEVTKPGVLVTRYKGNVTKTITTNETKYKGTVSKIVNANETKYRGTVYKGGYDYYYAYQVQIEYSEKSKIYFKKEGTYRKIKIYFKNSGEYKKVNAYYKNDGEYRRI